MTEYVDTREGWREVSRTEWGFHDGDDDSLIVRIKGVRRYFVSDENPLPTTEGLYQERYDDGTWGRVWELGDDGKWEALQGDSAEFNRWPLYPLVPNVGTQSPEWHEGFKAGISAVSDIIAPEPHIPFEVRNKIAELKEKTK